MGAAHSSIHPPIVAILNCMQVTEVGYYKSPSESEMVYGPMTQPSVTMAAADGMLNILVTMVTGERVVAG